MRRIFLLNILLLSIISFNLLSSCDNNEVNPEPTSVVVTGSSYDGIYVLDDSYTKGTKYIHESDDTQYIKSYEEEGKEMWGLFKKTSGGTYLYYKTEKTGTYPPESGWTCGLGVPKPNFHITAVFE